MEIIHWIKHNALFLLMLPANILAVEAIIRQSAVNNGYPHIVSWCDRIAKGVNFIQDIIAGLIKKTPPSAGTTAVVLSAILLTSTICFAQTTTTTTVTPPQITSIMDGLTADVGTGWDVRNKTWVQTDTVRFLEYKQTTNTGKYSAFLNFVGNVDPAVSVGYDTANKITVGGSFNLFVPKNWGLTSPLLSVVDISPFVQYEVVSMGNVPAQTKKGLIFGAYIIKGSA